MARFIQHALFASVADDSLRVLSDAATKCCLVFLFAAVTAIMLRNSSAAVRRLVWCVAILAFLLLPILSVIIPKWRVLPGWLSTRNISSGREDLKIPAQRPIASHATGVAPEDRSAAMRTTPANDPVVPLAASIAQPVAAHLLFTAWSIGCGLLLLRIALSRVILHRLLCTAELIDRSPIGDKVASLCRQLGVRHRVSAYQSAQRSMPMTWGLTRQILLIPIEASSWDRRRMRAVLLHELAHAKHFDTITHVMAQLVCAFYWFHPLVWLAAWRLQVERERACDDLVLRSGVKASDYAEYLLNILGKPVAPCIAVPMITQSGLEGRLRAILSDKINRKAVRNGAFALIVASGLTSATAVAMLRAPDRPATESAVTRSAESPSASSLSAQSAESPQSTIADVSVLCVDSQSNPVAGAEVHLFQLAPGKDLRYTHFGPFQSDEQGRAVCAEAIFSDEHGNFDRWTYARVPGRLVGVARSVQWPKSHAFNPDGRVQLRPSRSVEGRVTVPQGFDPTNVTVRVRRVDVLTGPGSFDYKDLPRYEPFGGLDTALPEIFERRPDTEGRICFEDVPVRGHLYLATTGHGLGEAQWRNDGDTFDEPIQLTVKVGSSVFGRVLAPSGNPAVGMKVSAQLSGGRQEARVYFRSAFQTVTNEDGQFAIHGLPQNEFVLSVEDPKKRWTFRPIENMLLQPKEERDLTLSMENGVLVTGRVFDPEGNPVELAHFSAISDSEIGCSLSESSTDASGRYQFRLPAGSAKLYFNALPDGFAYPDPHIVKQLHIESGQADIENLDFTIPRKQ